MKCTTMSRALWKTVHPRRAVMPLILQYCIARKLALSPVAHSSGAGTGRQQAPDWLPQCRMRCNTALMTGIRLALANLKPGTGKTTSAVWLAHVFAEAGNSVLLVDADPSGSALEWSDLAAMYPRLSLSQAAFPFRIVALPSRELHRRLPDIARDDDVVIIDTPQIEDHGAIARSALRYADEVLIPCAPSPIEINRTSPVRDEIAE